VYRDSAKERQAMYHGYCEKKEGDWSVLVVACQKAWDRIVKVVTSLGRNG
jgi:hypothetical protein